MLKLYSYQEAGVKQLLPEMSSLCGDDMGLGKTVEAVVLDAARRKKHDAYYTARTLVVTTKSVMGSWKKHYEEWSKLKVLVYDPKKKAEFIRELSAVDGRGRPKYHVFVTHWAAVRLMPELKDVKWFHITGDEIQAIKNRKAQVTVAFKKIKAPYKLALSGTWADNHPEDGWSILNWLWPKVWTSFWKYRQDHVKIRSHPVCESSPCESCGKWHRRAFTEVVGIEDVEKIHETMGRGYLRRTKDKVLLDLPDKYHTVIEVDLDPKQRAAYDQMAKEMLAWVGEHESEPVAAPVVISQLIRLQQFAVAYGKMEKGYKNTIHTDRHTGEKTKVRVETDVLRLTDPSTKLDAVMEMIEASSEPLVVFGQSKQAIQLLGERLAARKIPAGILTGDTKQDDRTTMVEEFQAGKLRVFAGTIRAGGVGITLTAASTVVFLDRAWSPSANRQAEDRLHRIGQKNAVQIVDIVARNTIDAARIEKIELKWEWLKKLLGGGSTEAKGPTLTELLQEMSQ
jgi:SNF2 family DNA or RNA helicase